MLPYFGLIGASLAGGVSLRRRPGYRWAFLLVMGLACWILSSLRYVIGFDYRSYEAIFQKITEGGLSSLRLMEPGFVLLNWIVAFWGGGYREFLFLFHLLFTVLVFVWIGRYSPSPSLSVYLFLTLQYFAMSMNLLRQSLAAALILWAYPFLLRRRFLPFCGIVFLAACFHKSAMILFPFYVLLNLRISKRHYAIAALTAGGIYLFCDPIFQLLFRFVSSYSSYTEGRYWQGNSAVYLLEPFGCFLFTLPLIRRTVQDPSASPVLANSVFYTMLIQIFITQHFILERLSIYTAFFTILALPEAVLQTGERRDPRIWTGLLLSCGAVYFLFAASRGFHGVYPYHGVWSMAISP